MFTLMFHSDRCRVSPVNSGECPYRVHLDARRVKANLKRLDSAFFRRIPSSVRCVKYIMCFFCCFFKCCLLTVYMVYISIVVLFVIYVKSSFLISHLVRQIFSPKQLQKVQLSQALELLGGRRRVYFVLTYTNYIMSNIIYSNITYVHFTHIFVGSTLFLVFDWFQVLFQKKISGLNHPAIVQQDFLTLISTRPGICSYFKTHKAAFQLFSFQLNV